MIDLVLLIARLLFVALLYLFLFAIMRTGIGMVKGSRKKERGWTVSVERGPKELRGVSIAVHGRPVHDPVALRNKDLVTIGDVDIRVRNQ